MRTPPYLNAGSRVGITSTARKITTKELEPFLNLLKSWDLIPVLGRTINAESDQFAGDDTTRVNDFQDMLDDQSIDAIWCARGGYGTVRLIDKLDFQSFLNRPKWVIGYSDITVLHAHIHRLGIETVHANMASEIEVKTKETRESIRKILMGESHRISIDPEGTLNRNGKCVGQVVGGNLSVLYSLLGSRSALNTDSKILFIEDLDEYLYHIDRMMMNLKRNGLFENLKGLIVGGMSDMNDNAIPFGKSAEEIINDILSTYKFPVCYHFPVGHIHDNRALILGREATLEIEQDQISLTY